VDDEIDWNLIDRYLAEEASPEEMAMLVRLRATNPAYDALLASLHRTLAASTPELEPEKMGEAWVRLSDAIRRDALAERPLKLHRGGEPRDASIAPVAARTGGAGVPIRAVVPTWAQRAARVSGTLAIAAVLIAAWQVWMARSASKAAPVMREVATTRGQRAQVDLGDGIRVVLAADSRLRYAAPERDRVREVFLEGEAYFDVVHDPARSFRVRTATAVAEDIGTRFGVRAFPGDSIVHIAVVSGSVAVGAATAPATERTVIGEGEVGQVARDGRHAVVRNADLDAYVGWREGRLVFDRTPLREVVRQVSRWYDLDIQLADSTLANRPLTATFGGESADDVVNMIGDAVGVRRERFGRRVLFLARPPLER
jgi:transmembrane sensor